MPIVIIILNKTPIINQSFSVKDNCEYSRTDLNELKIILDPNSGDDGGQSKVDPCSPALQDRRIRC